MRSNPFPIIAALGLLACHGSAPVGARLQECGLASEGTLGPVLENVLYAPNDCYRDCLRSAGCEELRAALCGDALDLLIGCDRRCAPRCADGALLPVEALCDGSRQCASGEDEENCRRFRCDDGWEIPGQYVCDGLAACPRGEDERDCPGLTLCETLSGHRVPIGPFACDGHPDCVDGADERGCPTYRCADGRTITLRPGVDPRCDGFYLCIDGSDEAGCATLTLMCRR